MNVEDSRRTATKGAIDFISSEFTIGIIVCLPLYVLYVMSLQRTIWLGDSAEFVTVSSTLGIPHPTGYPIYTWLGKLFTLLPIGDIPLRVSLMSATFATLSLFLIFLVMVELLKGQMDRKVVYLSGVLAVLSLGLFRPFWEHAEIPEVYTTHSLFTLSWIYLTLKWIENGIMSYLCVSSLVLGLSLGTHFSNILLVPLFLLIIFFRNKNNQKYQNIIMAAFFIGIGALQFLYILVRAKQSPVYLHDQARFFEEMHWTGTDNPIHNWIWFITGGRWRGSYSKSLSEVLSKARDVLKALVSNYGHSGIVSTFLGIIIYPLLPFDKKSRPRSTLLLGTLLVGFVYYLAYQPSEPGMILPFFACFSIFKALGAVLVAYSVCNIISLGRKKTFLLMITVIAIGSLLALPLFTQPAIDYSNRTGPADLVSKMIAVLPPGSALKGVRWAYHQVILYYSTVKGLEVPFTWAAASKPCDEEIMSEGKCFLLRDQLLTNREDLYLVPYLSVRGSPTLYKVITEKDSQEFFVSKENNPRTPVATILVTKMRKNKFKIELGQLGWADNSDPSMCYRLFMKARKLQNVNLEDKGWPAREGESGYVVEGGVSSFGADALIAYQLEEVKLELTDACDNPAFSFDAYYVDQSTVRVESVKLASDVTTFVFRPPMRDRTWH